MSARRYADVQARADAEARRQHRADRRAPMEAQRMLVQSITADPVEMTRHSGQASARTAEAEPTWADALQWCVATALMVLALAGATGAVLYVLWRCMLAVSR